MTRKYLAFANSAGGLANLMDNNLAGIEKIYTISGNSGRQKTEMLEEVLLKAEGSGCTAECVISPFDIKRIDAVIMREKGIAVADRNCVSEDFSVKNIDLDCVNKRENGITDRFTEKENRAIGELYKCFDEGKKIHDEWEKIYIQNMDYDKLEAYEKGVLEQLFKEKKGSGGRSYQRFFGTSTPDGAVNYIDNLTERLSARYFIKGRAGTGKSTFLKRVAGKAVERGFDIEVYYCGFDKNSLDMVIVPGLDFCVFDSTPPHEMFPQSQRDKILDFYEESGLLGTDEKYEIELNDVIARYDYKMAEGMAYLRLYKLYMKEKEYYLSKGLNKKKFSELKKSVIKEIFEK